MEQTEIAPKKKLLYVITKSNWGGAGRYVYDLATSMVDEFDVAVASGGHGELAVMLEQQGIRHIEIPDLERDISIVKEFSVFKSLKALFETERPDIVHLNSSKIGAVGSLVGRITKVPKIVFTAHGWAFNEDKNILWRTFVYVVSLLTTYLSHQIITISYKEESQATFFPLLSPKKINMVYISAREPKTFSKEEARATILNKNEFKVTDKTIWIGSIGELHNNKGYLHAIDVCLALKEERKDFVYVIIGDGEERKNLEATLEKLGLTDKVFLVGAIPTPSTGATLLRAFDIFLLPSVKEGLPYVLLEAGLVGLPIVASGVGGVPEIIEHEKSGFVARPGNELDIKRSIEALFYDERIRNDYSVAVKIKVSEQFKLADMISLTRNIYKN